MIDSFRSYKKRMLSARMFIAFSGTILVGFFSTTPSHAQSSAQNATAAAPVMEYEVATIKAYKPGSGEGSGMMRVGIMNAPDGFNAAGVTLQMLVSVAYG